MRTVLSQMPVDPPLATPTRSRLATAFFMFACATFMLAGVTSPRRRGRRRPALDRQDRAFLRRRQVCGDQRRPGARRPSLCRILHPDQPHAPLPDRDDRGLLPRGRGLHGHARRPRRLGPVFPLQGLRRSTSWIRSAAAARPMSKPVYGPKTMRSPKFVEREFIAYEKYNLYPQAKLHTQWPGPRHCRRSGLRSVHGGDAAHDRRRQAARGGQPRCHHRAARPDRPGDPDAAFAVRPRRCGSSRMRGRSSSRRC